MKVILTRDVPQVGKDGEILTVANGYARNYLFPRQLAVQARGGALKQHTGRIAREEAKGSQALTQAQQNGENLNGKAFTIIAKANPHSTRLFGSVTEADVADAILKQAGITVDKRKISLIDPIKVTGTYALTARLHAEVTSSFSVEVLTAEQLEERETQKKAEQERAAHESASASEQSESNTDAL